VPAGYSRRSWSLNNLFMFQNKKKNKNPTPTRVITTNGTNNKPQHTSNSNIMMMENIMRLSNQKRMF